MTRTQVPTAGTGNHSARSEQHELLAPSRANKHGSDCMGIACVKLIL